MFRSLTYITNHLIKNTLHIRVFFILYNTKLYLVL